MNAKEPPTIHASAVLVGEHAVLIRGPSGSGKSKLALSLLQAGRTGAIAPTRLVADDRLHVEAVDGTLLVRPAHALAGFLEVRGLGIRKVDAAAVAVVGLVTDLHAADAARLPEPSALETVISGIKLPRLPVAAGQDPLPLVVAVMQTDPRDDWGLSVGSAMAKK